MTRHRREKGEKMKTIEFPSVGDYGAPDGKPAFLASLRTESQMLAVESRLPHGYYLDTAIEDGDTTIRLRYLADAGATLLGRWTEPWTQADADAILAAVQHTEAACR